ncbi:hypothetical protein JYU34_018305 [Plutella xylostella]|uniref:Uncharacterized protein n=1 Tax=Plutella xylostella TaxID=51655 RepID=A0ABQ7Q0I1_PLUXY|nr:hypothetical protein JYU34_018305 [Plutella xylostella]
MALRHDEALRHRIEWRSRPQRRYADERGNLSMAYHPPGRPEGRVFPNSTPLSSTREKELQGENNIYAGGDCCGRRTTRPPHTHASFHSHPCDTLIGRVRRSLKQ